MYTAGYTLAGIKPPLQGLTSKDAQGAISLQNISQIGGTPLWLLTSGQIFQSLAFVNLGKALGGRGYTTAQICSAVAGTQSSLFKELSAELAAASAITEAIRRVYVLSITTSGVSIIAALLMKERVFAFLLAALEAVNHVSGCAAVPDERGIGGFCCPVGCQHCLTTHPTPFTV
ncbi:hypothetical protein AWENTII_002366 [Aspergillus wentii]